MNANEIIDTLCDTFEQNLKFWQELKMQKLKENICAYIYQ